MTPEQQQEAVDIINKLRFCANDFGEAQCTHYTLGSQIMAKGSFLELCGRADKLVPMAHRNWQAVGKGQEEYHE